MKKRTLVTAALPYANGPLHLGHMVEYVQADVFVRWLRLKGQEVLFVCADDTHGTAIEVNAAKKNITPEKLIAQAYEEHKQDFSDFLISFDTFHSTNSEENKRYSDLFFTTLKGQGYIYEKDIELTYDEKAQRFLPDRYVKGKCPRCGAPDQYGDNCERCNAVYKPTDLLEPYSVISGEKPTVKKSRHYFFKLGEFTQRLNDWLLFNKNLQDETRNYVLNWVKEGLQDWDISRDGPYFGFKIVGEENKYYYVWLDAPIGYIASTEHAMRKQGKSADYYWKDEDAEIIHFIGKDIMYFHFLFWPAMLMGTNFNLPDDIVVHGFLTVNGEKMSKSRGTFFTARDYLEKQQPELLRFYYAAALSHSTTDFDLDMQEFNSKINNELVGNVANFVYRVLSFVNNNFESKLGKAVQETALREMIAERIEAVKDGYDTYNYNRAIKNILDISALGNKYFQENQPWKLIRQDKKRCHEVVTFATELVRDLAVLLQPVLPGFAEKVQKQLGLEKLRLEDLQQELKHHDIQKARIVFTKLEEHLFDVGENKFALDLVVGQITEVKEHPDADKLYVLQVNIGKEARQLVAGLRSHYTPEQLLEKKVVVVKNLKPAKLRGQLSQGMVLAADNGKDIMLVQTEASSPGEKVHAGTLRNNNKNITIDEFRAVPLQVRNHRVVSGDLVLATSKEELHADISDGANVR